MEGLADEKAPGPAPSFSVFQLLIAVELMANKPIGRNKLAEELEVGEGTARTIIGRLKDAGLTAISKAGCSLTDKGLKFWKECQSIFKKTPVGKNELTLACCNCAVLVRNHGSSVRSGVEQRDAAVMAGAKAATTMVFKRGRLVFPSDQRSVDKDFPKASNELTRLLKPSEDDVIIVVSSDSQRKADYGALAAAWTILNDN